MASFISFKQFKWSAEIFMKQRDGGEDCGFLYTPAAGMILMRLRVGAAKPVYSFQPYPMIHPSKLEHLSVETMKKLPVPRPNKEHYLAVKKMIRSEFRREFIVKNHGHAYVLFFDVITTDSKVAKSRKAEEIVKLADSKVAENPKAEEIVKLLKASPEEVYVLRSSNKMEARMVKVKPVLCSICLEEVRKGENSASAPCSHLFHRSCYAKWMISFKKSTCPLCRRSLQVSEKVD